MRLVLFLAAVAILPAASAQTASSSPRVQSRFQLAPVPSDPLEPVTGETRVPASAEERAALVSLMERALENHNLHLHGGAPYHLQVSFSAAPSTLNPGGAGVLEESWVSGQNWRWSANVGGWSNLQIGSNGAVYGQSTAPMPIHFKVLRDALFAPVQAVGRQATLRSASVSIDGAPATCILFSGPQNEQTPAQGRQWYETEYCLNSASGAIRTWSPAPGIYVTYNYANAIAFHGRTLPGAIKVTVNGGAVLEAQLTSMTDANPNDLSPYTPTSQITAQGPATVGGLPVRFPLIMADASLAEGSVVQPTIVHVTLDASGKVLEAEPLQSSAVSERALGAVLNTNFGLRPQPAGASPLLMEAYINVQFRPPLSPAAAGLEWRFSHPSPLRANGQ